MIVTAPQLEIFQSCPARWKLLPQFPAPVSPTNEYFEGLKKTIYHMYAWLMSNNHIMSPKSVQGFWDQQWWVAGMKDESKKDKDNVFKGAANGWMLLERFYYNFYKRPGLLPVGINFDYTLQVGDIDYEVHFDLILADKDGNIEYTELGGRRNDWQVYTSLATKLEVCGLTQVLGRPPVKRLYFDILSKENDYVLRELNVSEEYVEESTRLVNTVSNNIASDAIYSAWSESCQTCPCAGKCWF